MYFGGVSEFFLLIPWVLKCFTTVSSTDTLYEIHVCKYDISHFDIAILFFPIDEIYQWFWEWRISLCRSREMIMILRMKNLEKKLFICYLFYLYGPMTTPDVGLIFVIYNFCKFFLICQLQMRTSCLSLVTSLVSDWQASFWLVIRTSYIV